jgi:hypothetical protein
MIFGFTDGSERLLSPFSFLLVSACNYRKLCSSSHWPDIYLLYFDSQIPTLLSV